MMNKFLLLTAFLWFQMAFSQKATPIYFDKDWEVTTKDNASFYRLMPMKEMSELMLIQDFYMNGTPQFEGYSLKNEEQKYVGDIVWYDENGNDDNFRQYENKTENTTLTYYHPNGKVRKKVHYKNGVKDGETIIYSTDGTVLMIGIYAEGKPVKGDFETVRYRNDYESYTDNDVETVRKDVPLPPAEMAVIEFIPQKEESDTIEAYTQPKKVEKKETVKQKIFWANSKQIAQETVYTKGSYNFKAIEQKNYDRSGKLIQSLDETHFEKYGNDILNGTDYDYYLQNNFATSIKTCTKYLNSRKNGKEVSYFPNGKIAAETLYTESSKEGEEITYSEDGVVKSKRIYKNGEAFQGNFDENVGEFKVNLNYMNGKKEGEAVAKNEEGEIFAKGIYKNGTPFNGTFIVQIGEYSNDQELIHVENFKKKGLQKMFGHRIDNPIKTYTIENEKLNGLVTFFENEKPIATIDYKNDEPYNGTLVESKSATTYKNGKITQETFYKDDYSDKDENNIKRQKFYENGILAKVSNGSFHITHDPKTLYEGIYKNGKPFSGYFETHEKSEFVQIDFYENGEKKYQYSNNYLKNMDNYRFQEYDIKSTYKNGKIFDGVEYSLQDRQFISKYLKNGVLQSFDWDLFAVHYFNRIRFELKGNAIEISDMVFNKIATLKIDNSKNSFKKELIVDGKTIRSTNIATENKDPEKYDNRLILYYLEKGIVVSKAMDMNQNVAEIEEYDHGMDLFYKIFHTINYETKNSQEIFNELSENIGTEEWLKKMENDDVLTGIRYNSSGKPHEGILINPMKNNTYSLQLYIEGKQKKQIENVDFENLKNEIEELSIVE